MEELMFRFFFFNRHGVKGSRRFKAFAYPNAVKMARSWCARNGATYIRTAVAS